MRLVRIIARPAAWKCLQGHKCLFLSFVRNASTSETKTDTRCEAVKSHDNTNLTRNLGIMAHIDAGKTTTTERILYFSGFSKHLGDVDRGDTVTDFMEQERERGITIQSAAVTYFWHKHKVNLIDTPGHIDFTVEVERSLRVLDGAITVLDASAGVEAQTLSVWRQADKFEVPRIIFLNKMDKYGANVTKCLNSIRDKLNIEPIPVHLPIGREDSFSGIVDLVTLEELTWDLNDSRDGSRFTRHSVDPDDIDDTFVETVMKARESLIGSLADYNETIAHCILNDECLSSLSTSVIRQALRTMTLSRKAVPVFCGSAKKNIGIQPLMDAILYYLPTPNDIKHDFIDYYDQSLCALAFKITHDSHRGPLTFARIYNGVMKTKADVYNVNQSYIEKVDIYQVNADQYRPLKEAEPGSIVCIGGLVKTRTGDTLTNSSSTAKKALSAYRKHNKIKGDYEDTGESILAGVDIPDPVFYCSIEAPSSSKQLLMEKALEKLQREDPSLHVDVNTETQEMIISGMGELHIDIVKNRLEKEHGIEVYLGPLQISYKEIITKTVKETLRFENTFGKTNSSVEITMRVQPDDSSKLFNKAEFSEDLVIASYHKKAINEGIKSALNYGPVFRCPVLNVAVDIVDFKILKRSNDRFVKAAAYECTTQALQNALPQLVEPIMALQVQMSEEYSPIVNADILRRRGETEGFADQNGLRVIHAKLPLSELMGYSTDLRTITSGTGSFTMQLSHHQILTQDEQDTVVGNYL